MGSIFEIVCEARGIPHPIISWRQNGQSNYDLSGQIENNRRKLIEVNNRNVAGSIECVAENGVGQPAIAGVDMVVLCKYRNFCSQNLSNFVAKMQKKQYSLFYFAIVSIESHSISINSLFRNFLVFFSL